MEILVVYAVLDWPLRATIDEHLFSFQRYATGHRCHYLNLAVRGVPAWLDLDRFDLIVFQTTCLSRWNPPVFAKLRRRAAPLSKARGVRIALPQDEFINTDLLCDFVNELAIDHVFSVAPASEWPKIYHAVDRQRVRFHQVLTGYLDDATIARIERLKDTPRDLDVGYRAWRAVAWLGRHGILKTRLSDEVARRGAAHGLAVDCSTREEDTLLGDAWFRFLSRCRYTIGVEGGASILDRDGSVKARTEAYVAAHPDASFDAIEAACFPGRDGELSLFALSPRHLEACATRTGQVLVEGDYNGILKPHEHYIPLKPDLSDLDAVLEAVKADDSRQAMTERAYQDVVASGRYTYRGFVSEVLGLSFPHGLPAASEAGSLPWRRMALGDKMSWARVAVTAAMKRRGRKLLPAATVARLRELKNR